MKETIIIICASLCLAFISCGRHDTSITLKDTDRYYTMYADFPRSKAHKVEAYLERNFGIARDNRLSIHKSPGRVKVRFDKTDNYREAYYQVRMICEGMEEVVR